MINYNDSNAIKLKNTNAYPNGANSATEVSVYKCPCKKGRIVYENVRGFGDRYATFNAKLAKVSTILSTGEVIFGSLKKNSV